MCNPKRVYIPKIVKEVMLKDIPDRERWMEYEQLVKQNALENWDDRMIVSGDIFDFAFAKIEDKKRAFNTLFG